MPLDAELVFGRYDVTSWCCDQCGRKPLTNPPTLPRNAQLTKCMQNDDGKPVQGFVKSEWQPFMVLFLIPYCHLMIQRRVEAEEREHPVKTYDGLTLKQLCINPYTLRQVAADWGQVLKLKASYRDGPTLTAYGTAGQCSNFR